MNSVLYQWNKEAKVSTSNTLIRELAQFVLVQSSSSTRNVIYYSGELIDEKLNYFIEESSLAQSVN